MPPKAEAKTEKSAPAATKPTQVGVAVGNALTVEQQAGRTAVAAFMEQDAGAGFEEAGTNAYAIPFLYILQSGSPQCKRSDPRYIPGAEEGMLLNTVSGKIYDVRYDPKKDEDGEQQGINFVPAQFAMRFIEWRPRESGGGFVAEHPPTTPLAATTVKDEKNRDKLANGNNLVDTRNHWGIVLDPENPEPIIVSMSSTQVKKSRKWMSMMSAMKIKIGTTLKPCPMFGYIWRLTTIPEKNDQGSWFGWKIDAYGPVTDEALYKMAREFGEAVRAGRVQAQVPTEDIVGDATRDADNLDA